MNGAEERGDSAILATLMDWEHKGVRFEIELESLGSFVLASARADKAGPVVRIRPFSSLGRSEDEALELLKGQIRLEFRKVPAPPA